MEAFFYDRDVCTGLGDRVGALMTLLTLARMYDCKIYFRWCEDPSIIYKSQREHMPKWYGFSYDLSQFKSQFWGRDISRYVQILSSQHYESNINYYKSLRKVKYIGNEVPTEAGLDQIYTTASKTTSLYVFSPDHKKFMEYYKVATHMVLLHTFSNDNFSKENNFDEYPPKYIVVHMRVGDLNTYTPYLGSHDHPRVYCTRKVVKAVIQRLDSNIYVISNNVTWARRIIGLHPRLLYKEKSPQHNDNEDYKDFRLLLGASAIIQHANYGWSAFSNNPSMMANIPLITTYKSNKQHFRYDTFRHYGQLPPQFHQCEDLDAFISKITT